MNPFDFSLPAGSPLSLINLIINLAIGVPLSVILCWHYTRFGSTLSNREDLNRTLPFILLTTTLIITIVKSSLALSLGLVGALSIVRFRTPIKEPEELAYLFIAIAMGLGLGADQVIPTVVAGLLILVIMATLRFGGLGHDKMKLYLSIDLAAAGDQQAQMRSLNEVIDRHAAVSDLRRIDSRDGMIEATFFVDVEESDQVAGMIEDLSSSFPGIGVSFIDQSRMPTV